MSNSLILANYLNDNYPIEQMRFQMYLEEDIYHEIPSLMFRFSKELDDSIYDVLRICIESYVGNLEWTELQSLVAKRVKNHLICPRRYYEHLKYAFENNILLSDKEYFSEEEYKEICEKAIADIPNLFEHIKKNFKPNLEDYKK